MKPNMLFKAQRILNASRAANDAPIWSRIHDQAEDLGDVWQDGTGRVGDFGEVVTGYFRHEEKEAGGQNPGTSAFYYNHPVLMGVKVQGEITRYMTPEVFEARVGDAAFERMEEWLENKALEDV